MHAKMVQEGVYPSFKAKRHTARKGCLAITCYVEDVAEIRVVEIDRAKRQMLVKNHLRLHGSKLLHEVFGIARRIEEWIGGVLPCHRQTNTLQKMRDVALALGQKAFDFGCSAQTYDFPH